MKSRRFVQPEAWLTYELALVGGYCDAASFVLTKTFTGHVTGNLVLAAISMAAHDWKGLFAHLFAIGTFLTGTALSMLFVRRYRVEGPSRLSASIMLLEGVLIGCASQVRPVETFPRLEIFVMIMSLALGLQNGSFNRSEGIGTHTTYVTGDITSLLSAETAAPALGRTREISARPDSTVRLLSYACITFVAAAGLGATMALRFGAAALLGAAAVVGVVALMEV